MKQKILLILVSIFSSAMLLMACADDNAGVKEPTFITEQQKIPGEEEDLGFVENLPPSLAARGYQPSLRPRLYRPILVEYFTANSAKTEFTRILRNMADFTPDYQSATYKAKTNKYGSDITRARQAATGRYYVKKVDGRWWIIDPEGYIHYERSVASVRRGASARNVAAWNAKYGTEQKWIADLQSELAFLGIHGSGAFSTGTGSGGYKAIQNHNTAHPEAPLSLSPSFGTLGNFRTQTNKPYPGGDADNAAGLVFYEDWPEFCKSYINYELTPYKDDPNILGFFSDNEIDFSSMTVRMLDRFLKVNDPNDPAYAAAKAFMDSKETETVTDALNDEFSGIVAEKYYKGVKEARDEVAPGVMYMGTRLHGTPKYMEGIIRAAGKYCDVISINYYSRWSPELTDWVANWDRWAPNAPFIVTEFYTKAKDNDLDNSSGAGFAVSTQQDKAYAFQHFTLGLLEATNCIGWQWFRYQDEDFPDASNKPSNKGLYDNYYELYPYLAAYMRRFNYNVYELADYFDGK